MNFLLYFTWLPLEITFILLIYCIFDLYSEYQESKKMNHTPITLNNIVPKDASYDCSAGTPLSCYQIPSTLKWTRCPICEGDGCSECFGSGMAEKDK